MVTRTGTVPGTDSVTPGGAPIIGGDYRNSDGPGPEVMTAFLCQVAAAAPASPRRRATD